MPRRIKIVKKGTPLPGKPNMGFVSSHLNKEDAFDAEHKEYHRKGTEEVLTIKIPKQYAVYRSPIKISSRKVPRLKK